MSLRVGARALTPALRRVAYRQARTIAPKQFSSNPHSAPKSSDTPWIVRRRHPLPPLSTRSQLVVRAHRLGLRSSLSRRSGFRHCLRVTLTAQALYPIDNLSFFTLCALQTTSSPQRHWSWRAPRSCGEYPHCAPSARTRRAHQSMPSLLSSIYSGRLSPRRFQNNEETIADAEGTEVPAEEVKASIIQAAVRFPRIQSLVPVTNHVCLSDSGFPQGGGASRGRNGQIYKIRRRCPRSGQRGRDRP